MPAVAAAPHGSAKRLHAYNVKLFRVVATCPELAKVLSSGKCLESDRGSTYGLEQVPCSRAFGSSG